MRDVPPQLLSALTTVTKRTPRYRVRNLRRMTSRIVDRGGKVNPITVAKLYYLRLGTVPRSLWDNS
jgi:hypothetical protein